MEGLERLVRIVDRLRDPENGCPWDLKQTPRSLIPNFVEELYEVIEAIEADHPENLREELGDLMLHIVLQARMAKEKGLFDIEASLQDICEKLIRRHPHIFGDDTRTDAHDVKMHWERLKQGKGEKKRDSVLDGVPKRMPALIVAQRLQEKAASVGFDWPGPEPVFDKLREECLEFEEAWAMQDKSKIEEELGDLFFTLVNLARKLHIDSETALRNASEKFDSRFRRLEQVYKSENRPIHNSTLEEMDVVWESVKKG